MTTLDLEGKKLAATYRLMRLLKALRVKNVDGTLSKAWLSHRQFLLDYYDSRAQ